MKTWTGYYKDKDYCPSKTHDGENDDYGVPTRKSKRQRYASIDICNIKPPVTKDASAFRNNQRVYYVNDGVEFIGDDSTDNDTDDDEVVFLGTTTRNPHNEEQDNATRATEEEEEENNHKILNTLQEHFNFNYVEGDCCNVCVSHHNVIDRGCCDYKMCKGCFTTWMYSSGNHNCPHCRSSQHPNIPSGIFLMFKRCFVA